MKVLVTGGTGFVGSHSTVALLAGGHRVTMLVREPAKVAKVLAPHGVPAELVDLVEGDATDESAVAAAIDGCDAVLNCVSRVSVVRRDAEEVRRVKVRSAEVVLGAAAAGKLDPIIHVSSVSALLPPPAGVLLTPDSPVGEPLGAYMRSKAAADRFARRLQDRGVPVVLIYPTMVVGPIDPSLGEGMGTIAMVLKGQVPALPPGGMEVIDVRDLAAVHLACMLSGRGQRRYIVNGTHLSARQLVERLRQITGRRLPFAPVPAAVVKVAAAAGGALSRFLPISLPLTSEAAWVLALDAESDDSATRTDLGIAPRPLDDTLRDTVAWMAASGVVTRRQAGGM